MRRWFAVFALVSLLTVGLHSAATPAPTLASGCYYSSYSHGELQLGHRQYTRWYYGVTTSSCADLNLKLIYADYNQNVMNCTIYALGQYYSNSQAQWVSGTAGWVPMRLTHAGSPGGNVFASEGWYTPLTNLADGTRVRWIYYPVCGVNITWSNTWQYSAK